MTAKVIPPKGNRSRPIEDVPRVRTGHFIDPRLLSVLDQQAAKEGRSRGGLIEIMVREGLAKRGAIDIMA